MHLDLITGLPHICHSHPVDRGIRTHSISLLLEIYYKTEFSLFVVESRTMKRDIENEKWNMKWANDCINRKSEKYNFSNVFLLVVVIHVHRFNFRQWYNQFKPSLCRSCCVWTLENFRSIIMWNRNLCHTHIWTRTSEKMKSRERKIHLWIFRFFYWIFNLVDFIDDLESRKRNRRVGGVWKIIIKSPFNEFERGNVRNLPTLNVVMVKKVDNPWNRNFS